MKLYTYFRSSAAYRVRIALALKGLDYEAVPVHLLRDGGEQHRPEYRAIHPGGLVPALQTDGGEVLVQSLAIIEYLEETHPEPPLLPPDPLGRARVRGLALTIACDTHPLNNLGVLRYLTERLGASEEQKLDWIRHWIERGLGTFERLLDDPRTGRFCHGDTPTLADCCLVPQVFNARRYECSLEAFPRIRAVVEACEALPAFQEAAPARQPDAPQPA